MSANPGYGFAYFRWRTLVYSYCWDETPADDAVVRACRQIDGHRFYRLQLAARA